MFRFLTNLVNFSTENALAAEFARRIESSVSVKLMTERRQVLSAKRVSQLLEDIYESARKQQAINKRGTVKRAILANSFRWELKSKGFPEDFIRVATEGLVIALSGASTPDKRR